MKFTEKDVEKKANELAKKFSPHVNPYIGSGMLSNTHDDSAIEWQSLQCAIIVVDEILVLTPRYSGNINPIWQFWNEVKGKLTDKLKNK